MITVFEFLAMTEPWILRCLETLGLLVITDHIPESTFRMMSHGAYKRVTRGRIRQVRAA